MRILYKDNTGDLCVVDADYLFYFCSPDIDGPKGLCFICGGKDYYVCKEISRYESEEYVIEAFRTGVLDLRNYMFKNATKYIVDSYTKDLLDFFM